MRSKIAFVICGALLVGGVSGALVAFSAAHHAPTATASGPGLTQGSTTSPTATVTPGGDATATDTPAGNPSNNPNPTAVPTPTQPIRPSPTPFGQVDLQGTIASTNLSANTFVLNIPGGQVTCVVTSKTNWSGTAKSVGDLQSRMPAEVHGVYQSDGTLLATEVNAQDA